MKFKVLIDTNIIIYSEDNTTVSSDIQEFHKLSKNFDVFVHPKVFSDINNDRDEERKNIIKSKIQKYQILDFKLEPDDSYYLVVKYPQKTNDAIDDNLLFTVEKGVCNYLVTEDRGIYSKALALGIVDKVFSVASFNEFIRSQFSTENNFSSLKGVTHDFVHNIALDTHDEIFDTLKEDYNFDFWYKNKVIDQHRKGFFILSDHHISALCLYDENNMEYKNAIKISTFKVSEKIKWQKRWELILRQIIMHWISMRKQNLYIEVKNNKIFFINWLLSFWFESIWSKKGDTDSTVLRKNIMPVESDNGIVKNYPYYFFWEDTNIFLIPIQSQYATKLFPNSSDQLSLNVEDNVCWNTIKKSYLSNKKITSFKKWDLIFFYLTWTWKSSKYDNNQRLISFGVIDDFLYTRDLSEAISFIWKRSVYTIKEIEKMVETWISIINFRYCDDFKSKLTYEMLLQENIINWPIQSILKIENKNKAIILFKKFLWYYYR